MWGGYFKFQLFDLSCLPILETKFSQLVGSCSWVHIAQIVQCRKPASRWVSHCVTDSHLLKELLTMLLMCQLTSTGVGLPPSLPRTPFSDAASGGLPLWAPTSHHYLTLNLQVCFSSPKLLVFLISFQHGKMSKKSVHLQLHSLQSAKWGGPPGTAALRNAGNGRAWVQEAAGLQKEFQHRPWLKNKPERTKERKQHKTKPYLQDLGNWFRIFITFSFLSVNAISQGCYQDYGR